MGLFYCVYYDKKASIIFVQAHLTHELALDQKVQTDRELYDHIHSYLGLPVHVFTEERFLFDDDWIEIVRCLRSYSEMSGMNTHSE